MFKLATTFYEGGEMAMSFIELTYVSEKEFMDVDLKSTTISPLQTIITNMQELPIWLTIEHFMVTPIVVLSKVVLLDNTQ